MPSMPHPHQPGSTVIVRDEEWRVAGVDAFEACSVLTLEAAGRRRLRVIDPADCVAPARRRRIAPRRRRAVVQTALQELASARAPLTLWTAANAAIDLLPHQLEPALAILRGATRVLLADAVGLGKTIQAALILAELRERGWADRSLVLCPPGLRATWAGELRDRFGIACAVFDQASIADSVAALPPAVNPWSMHATIVASIDLAKRPEVMAAISEVPVDLVIADEAHHLTPGSDRGDAVRRLALRSPWCVFVSATPHSGDEAAFDYLTHLGSHEEPIAIFRRTRGDAGFAAPRREHIVRIRPGAAEAELLAEVERYAHAIWHGRGAVDPALQLVAITIARRAASSPLALERTLRRRLALLTAAPEPVQATLPWDETDEADGSGLTELLARAGLDSESTERSTIERLLALIARCETGAKLQWLLRAMRRIKEPAIVFTEYRDTLEALLVMLPASMRAVSICGATPVDLRRAAIDAFNAGDADLLVATDTAGEGINLHHRCRLVIDVELPWNPMRLEQRLGRVDRIGQRRRVHALRLFHRGSIEERVLDRLQLRRRRAAAIDGAMDERVVAAGVFGSDHVTAKAVPPIASRVVGGAALEHARLIRQRSIAGPSASIGSAVATPPRRPATTAMVTLHSVAYVSRAGSMIADLPCAHLVEVDASCFDKRVGVAGAIAASPDVGRSMATHCEANRASIARDLAPFTGALARRISSIRSYLAADHMRTIQPSLFDGRADRAADRDRATLATLDAALRRRAVSVDASVPPDGAAVRLVAIWPAVNR